tara:strand:- start:75 stop:434 length:360 start_codon:yes stop_codon:yes gene_type:complete
MGVVELEMKIEQLEKEVDDLKRELSDERELAGERTQVLENDLTTMTTKLREVAKSNNDTSRKLKLLQEEKETLNKTNKQKLKSMKERFEETKQMVANLKTEQSQMEYREEQSRVTIERL